MREIHDLEKLSHPEAQRLVKLENERKVVAMAAKKTIAALQHYKLDEGLSVTKLVKIYTEYQLKPLEFQEKFRDIINIFPLLQEIANEYE